MIENHSWCPEEATKETKGLNAIPCRKAQAAGDVAMPATAAWQRRRYWFAPAPHLLLAQAVALGPETAGPGEQTPGCQATLLPHLALDMLCETRERTGHDREQAQALWSCRETHSPPPSPLIGCSVRDVRYRRLADKQHSPWVRLQATWKLM